MSREFSPVVLMGASLMFAQSIAFSQSQADESPQNLVHLSAVATDAKGEPLSDLKASDVQVREDGKTRPIVFFRYAGPKRPTLPAVEGEFSNKPAAPPTIILLDRWNEAILTAASAWLDIGSALKRMESVDRVYIYFLTNKGDLYPVEPLPSDTRATTPTGDELAAKLDEAVRKLPGFRNVDADNPILRANTTLRVLTSLGQLMATIAGRKNLIWVTHGFPLTVRVPGGQYVDFTSQVRGLSANFAQSQIAIYTVDQSAKGAGEDPAGLARATAEMFSSHTGGRWYGSGNVDIALAGSQADGRGSYRIGYDSAVREMDKKEHKIKLESPQKGVRLLTREDYFGVHAPDPIALERAMLIDASRAALDAGEIGLRVGLSRNPDGNANHLLIHFDVDDILLQQQGGQYKGRVGLMIACYADGSPKQATAVDHIELNLTQEQYAKAQKEGIFVERNAAFPIIFDQLRVLVFDWGMNGVGSVTVPVK
jgi:VWFA-related protein